jgi:hypothetical protein
LALLLQRPLEDCSGSKSPTLQVLKMDLLDNARTFLQRANHLHQNLVLKTRKRSFAFVRHSNLPRVTEREDRLRVTAERRLYKWSKGASGREMEHIFATFPPISTGSRSHPLGGFAHDKS